MRKAQKKSTLKVTIPEKNQFLKQGSVRKEKKKISFGFFEEKPQNIERKIRAAEKQSKLKKTFTQKRKKKGFSFNKQMSMAGMKANQKEAFNLRKEFEQMKKENES